MIKEYFERIILKQTGASSITGSEKVQSLWSGYGQLLRLTLKDSTLKSIIAKHIQAPKQTNHPRGWNTDVGHQRKLKSYEIEAYWYQNYSAQSKARVPKCYAVQEQGSDLIILMEDLNLGGFGLRKDSLTWEEVCSCLKWLAGFHASYYKTSPQGLWKEGSYWHLNTRLQELENTSDPQLKKAAFAIASKLNSCEHKTIIHGDAKLANFCFSKDGKVAGVDFQYVGGGCGMKDVAYFVGSCMSEVDCERLEPKILDTYFEYLQDSLEVRSPELELEWRSLYRVAWADFYRFLKGWSPDHWKINSYSERISQEVIKNL